MRQPSTGTGTEETGFSLSWPPAEKLSLYRAGKGFVLNWIYIIVRGNLHTGTQASYARALVGSQHVVRLVYVLQNT